MAYFYLDPGPGGHPVDHGLDKTAINNPQAYTSDSDYKLNGNSNKSNRNSRASDINQLDHLEESNNYVDAEQQLRSVNGLTDHVDKRLMDYDNMLPKTDDGYRVIPSDVSRYMPKKKNTGELTSADNDNREHGTLDGDEEYGVKRDSGRLEVRHKNGRSNDEDMRTDRSESQRMKKHVIPRDLNDNITEERGTDLISEDEKNTINERVTHSGTTKEMWKSGNNEEREKNEKSDKEKRGDGKVYEHKQPDNLTEENEKNTHSKKEKSIGEDEETKESDKLNGSIENIAKSSEYHMTTNDGKVDETTKGTRSHRFEDETNKYSKVNDNRADDTSTKSNVIKSDKHDRIEKDDDDADAVWNATKSKKSSNEKSIDDDANDDDADDKLSVKSNAKKSNKPTSSNEKSNDDDANDDDAEHGSSSKSNAKQSNKSSNENDDDDDAYDRTSGESKAKQSSNNHDEKNKYNETKHHDTDDKSIDKSSTKKSHTSRHEKNIDDVADDDDAGEKTHGKTNAKESTTSEDDSNHDSKVNDHDAEETPGSKHHAEESSQSEDEVSNKDEDNNDDANEKPNSKSKTSNSSRKREGEDDKLQDNDRDDKSENLSKSNESDSSEDDEKIGDEENADDADDKPISKINEKQSGRLEEKIKKDNETKKYTTNYKQSSSSPENRSDKSEHQAKKDGASDNHTGDESAGKSSEKKSERSKNKISKDIQVNKIDEKTDRKTTPKSKLEKSRHEIKKFHNPHENNMKNTVHEQVTDISKSEVKKDNTQSKGKHEEISDGETYDDKLGGQKKHAVKKNMSKPDDETQKLKKGHTSETKYEKEISDNVVKKDNNNETTKIPKLKNEQNTILPESQSSTTLQGMEKYKQKGNGSIATKREPVNQHNKTKNHTFSSNGSLTQFIMKMKDDLNNEGNKTSHSENKLDNKLSIINSHQNSDDEAKSMLLIINQMIDSLMGNKSNMLSLNGTINSTNCTTNIHQADKVNCDKTTSQWNSPLSNNETSHIDVTSNVTSIFGNDSNVVTASSTANGMNITDDKTAALLVSDISTVTSNTSWAMGIVVSTTSAPANLVSNATWNTPFNTTKMNNVTTAVTTNRSNINDSTSISPTDMTVVGNELSGNPTATTMNVSSLTTIASEPLTNETQTTASSTPVVLNLTPGNDTTVTIANLNSTLLNNEIEVTTREQGTTAIKQNDTFDTTLNKTFADLHKEIKSYKNNTIQKISISVVIDNLNKNASNNVSEVGFDRSENSADNSDVTSTASVEDVSMSPIPANTSKIQSVMSENRETSSSMSNALHASVKLPGPMPGTNDTESTLTSDESSSNQMTKTTNKYGLIQSSSAPHWTNSNQPMRRKSPLTNGTHAATSTNWTTWYDAQRPNSVGELELLAYLPSKEVGM